MASCEQENFSLSEPKVHEMKRMSFLSSNAEGLSPMLKEENAGSMSPTLIRDRSESESLQFK